MLGTVRFAGALHYEDTQGGRQPDGTYFFKAGAEIHHGPEAVTLTIAPQMQGEAAFLFEHADGYAQQVTVESCPDRDIWFVSGFILRERPSACLPVDVQVGRSPTQRIVVSLAAGAC